MNKFLCFIFMSILFVNFAMANENELDQRILRSVRQINRLAQRNLYRLNVREKRFLLRSLHQSRRILNGGYPNPTPGPNPTPTVCSNDNMDDYKRAFQDINRAAYSSSGLNLPREEAKRYAQSWANRYPCRFAESFGRDLISIRIFSSSINGLDLDRDASVTYSKGIIHRFCGDRNFKNEFMTAYRFAGSSSGLNLPEDEARAYGKSKMERRHFVCRYGDHLDREEDEDDWNGGGNNGGLPFPIIVVPQINLGGGTPGTGVPAGNTN